MKVQGNRKFFIALVLSVMTFILAMTDRVSGAEWNVAIGLILGLFGAANLGVHVAQKRSDEERNS